MIQFKDQLFNNFQFSKDDEITKHFLVLPQQCAKSVIVYGEMNNDYKSIAEKLYLKYVKEDGFYETMVDWTTRKYLEALIDSPDWAANQEFEDPLKL